jgi:hypothetical protein
LSQIFHPSTNTIARASFIALALGAGGLLAVMASIQRSSYVTQAYVALDQPVPFSHQHHAGGMGIDCRYCHTSVEESAFAGIPPTATCMNCHTHLFKDAPTLEPVRESYRTGRSIRWARVHNLADFAYFDHSIHVAKGVACVTCHGRVDRMALIWKTASLQMEWCLECHRNPGAFIGPREEVFNMDWQPPADRAALAERLLDEYDIHTRTDCSTCHR